MASLNVKILRVLFGTVERIAPSFGGRAAFALFCRTPGRMATSERERRAIVAAADFMARGRRHCLRTGYGAIVAHEFTNWGARRDGPAALVLHGWRSRTEHMRVVVEALLARGFRVVALDLPGHGASAGRSLNMANAVTAVHAASLWLGPFEVAVGHSFGGAVALNAAVGSVARVPAVPLKRLVMIAAPNSMPALFAQFGRFVGLGRRTQSALEAQVEAVAGRGLETFAGARLLAGLGLPTLVIHAPEDKEVSARDADEMASAGDHVRLVWAPGLGHRRILGDAAVAGQAADFVATREADVTFGAEIPALGLCSPSR